MNPSVLEACVKGYSHIQSGKECQDSCKSEKLQDGTLLLSVADGHGSKSSPHSKDGSDIAVNVFCQTLSDLYLQNCGKRDELIRFLNQEGNLRLAQALERKWKDRVYRTHVDMLHREVPTYDDGRENLSALYRMYGTTLLGMVIAPDFFFVFQLGDGDIVYVDDRGVQNLVEADKLLGVESDSLCSQDAWKKAVSALYRREWDQGMPYLFQLSTDGFANSFVSDEEFHKTCAEYFEMLKQYGPEVVQANLESWLDETSRLGCGDDTTALIAYFTDRPPEVSPGGEPLSEEASQEEEPKECTQEPAEATQKPELSAEPVSEEQEMEYESNSDFTEMPQGEQAFWYSSSDDGQWGMVSDLGLPD